MTKLYTLWTQGIYLLEWPSPSNFPPCMDKRKIFLYTMCKDTTFYTRCFLGMAHSHVWPTFGFIICPYYYNLKAVSDVFCGWTLQTLIQIDGWTVSDVMFQWHWKILLLRGFCFWCVLLLWKLWWKELGELVSEMEHNLSCSMKILHELCGSCFCKEIGRMISGKQGDEVMKSIFDVGWGSEGMFFWWWKKTKLLDFLEYRKVCVGFRFWVL